VHVLQEHSAWRSGLRQKNRSEPKNLKKVSIDTMLYKRPSYKEINSKIKQAKDAVLRNRISIVNTASVAADALELGYLASGP